MPEFIHGELQDTDARLSMVTQLLTVGTVVVMGWVLPRNKCRN